MGLQYIVLGPSSISGSMGVSLQGDIALSGSGSTQPYRKEK